MNRKELDFIIQQGEGQFLEFKESFSSSLSKEIVAFANSSGGNIYLGITDNALVKGINITNKLKSEIHDLARNCDPVIKLSIKEYQKILIIEVFEGKNKPYSCSNGFYMRVGSNSQKMTRDEILSLAIKAGRVRFDEQICVNFDWKDFDEEKLIYYMKLAGISYNLDRDEILKSLRVLTEDGLTNAGVLYFSKNPYKYILSSKIRCVHFNDDTRIEILDKKEVDRGIIGNIEFAINYIKELVPIRFEIEKLARDEYPEYSEKAYREAIINAIIHFDYYEGSNVAIEKLKNSIFINNKGALLFDEKEFGKRSELRNRLLADLLSRTEYMEKVGTGINRMKESCRLNDNRLSFNFTDSFSVEIYAKDRANEGVNEGVNEGANEGVNEGVKSLYALIMNNPNNRTNFFAKELNTSVKNIERWIKQLKVEGKIDFIGSPKTGGYVVK